MVRKRGDGKARDQREGVEGGHKDLAESFVPLISGVLPSELDDAVHGDGDAHVEDMGAS